nr:helix-turn-helix domain-containing protein [Nocardia terpenica]
MAMALGVRYPKQNCSLARALEAVGERWTMLILRDAFYGVRRFTDFADHLDISKAVLTQRLSMLIEQGILVRERSGGHDDYVLTERGRSLWPALYALMRWGEHQTDPPSAQRLFFHAECGTRVDAAGYCAPCRYSPGPEELEVHPGPGMRPGRTDAVSIAMRTPHRLLEPLDTRAHARGTTK